MHNAKIGYVIPVHNDAEILSGVFIDLISILNTLPRSRAVFVENGSHDASLSILESLAAGHPRIQVLSTPSKGIGYAYDLGARLLRQHVDWVLFTASDLPFGRSDLDAFLAHITSKPDLIIGSKAARGSRIETSIPRRLMRLIFTLLRRHLLSMRTQDSQGTLFIRTPFLNQLVDQVRSRDFFYSTELVYIAERCLGRIIEVPCLASLPRRSSTIRPLKDSLSMLRQLMTLSLKERRAL